VHADTAATLTKGRSRRVVTQTQSCGSSAPASAAPSWVTGALLSCKGSTGHSFGVPGIQRTAHNSQQSVRTHYTSFYKADFYNPYTKQVSYVYYFLMTMLWYVENISINTFVILRLVTRLIPKYLLNIWCKWKAQQGILQMSGVRALMPWSVLCQCICFV